ncbi:hypothetical protein FTX61_12430 [Nitriliruptoraceae bacterium ZYF776]|nr:hypothetical protein [Profundirhabdus halotolerans]
MRASCCRPPVRCGRCGARNGASADWCTQCFTALTGPAGAPASADAPATPREHVPPPSDAPRPVRLVDGQVEWRCATCAGWSPLEAGRCAVCGASRPGFGAGVAELRPVAPASAAAWSIVPGAGHLRLGRRGAGSVRLLLAVGSVALAAWLWRAGAGGVATVVALAVLGLAATSALDARALASGRREPVGGRGILAWLAVVLATLLVAFLLRLR